MLGSVPTIRQVKPLLEREVVSERERERLFQEREIVSRERERERERERGRFEREQRHDLARSVELSQSHDGLYLLSC